MIDGLHKRSVSLSGHRTSVALELEFWAALEAEAGRRSLSLAALLDELDRGRGPRPLAGACRLAVLGYLSRAADTL